MGQLLSTGRFRSNTAPRALRHCQDQHRRAKNQRHQLLTNHKHLHPHPHGAGQAPSLALFPSSLLEFFVIIHSISLILRDRSRKPLLDHLLHVFFPPFSFLFAIYLFCFDCIIMVLTKAACRSLLIAARARRIVSQQDSRVPYTGWRVQRSFSSELPRPPRTCTSISLRCSPPSRNLLYSAWARDGGLSLTIERLRVSALCL